MTEVPQHISALLSEERVFEETTVADLAERHRRMAPTRPVFSSDELLSRLP